MKSKKKKKKILIIYGICILHIGSGSHGKKNLRHQTLKSNLLKMAVEKIPLGLPAQYLHQMCVKVRKKRLFPDIQLYDQWAFSFLLYPP